MICLLIRAQDNTINNTEKEYHYLQQTLNKETTNHEKDTTNLKILHPASLPSWLASLPPSDENISYALGISDPGMDEESAFKLAESRAKSVIGLLTHPRITSMIDNFSNEEYNTRSDEFVTKYENIFNIETNLASTANNFEIVNQYFTSFGEAVVLMKYNHGASAPELYDTTRVMVNTYQVERQKSDKYEIEDRYEIEGFMKTGNDSLDNLSFSYSYKSLNNLVEIESRFGYEVLPFPYANFRYMETSDSLSTIISENLTRKLNYGLWKAYIETLTKKIALLSHALSGNIKQVGDDYSSQNKNLSREISESNPSFKINCIQISNNCITIDVDYLNKPK
jgi:hypothetical protein